MTAAPAPASPLTLKVIGWLNVAFGAILMLCVTCVDGYVLMVPALQNVMEEQQRSVQKEREARRDGEIRALRDQEEQAETAEAKAGIRAQRIALEGTPLDVGPPPPSFDVSVLGLDDPRVKIHFAADAVSGLVVNLLLLISGIGLIRLRSWGRKMAVGVAALKLVRVAIVGASMILVLTPIRNEKLLQPPPAAEKVPQEEAPTSLKWASMLTTALYLALFSAYPIVVLVLLTRPSARAAVAKPGVAGDF